MLVCLRCGHKWEPLVENPIRCPSCKSLRWKKRIPNAPVLNGGNLIFYLKNNRREVLRYFKKHGLPATLNKYNVSQPTLERFFAGGYGEKDKLSPVDRAIALGEIAIASNSELRRELREMRLEYNQFVENISETIMTRLACAFRATDITMPEGPGLLEYKEKELAITE